ncbi:MAG: LysM peptidoglycan-binding domain-containing protein [Anaerolineae bacterium]|nr:LysM peptidoglycan-binding domain-containing protein [Anaerolineae bacterium]
MADKQGPLVRGYNIFKGVVTTVIIGVIIILLLSGGTGLTGEPSQRIADLPTSQPTEIDTPEPVIEPTLETPTIGEPEVKDDGTVKLQGQGTPGSKVAIWAGGKRLGEATVGDDGTWAYTAEMEPGDHEITAKTLDAAGAVAAESEPLAFTMPEPEEEIAAPRLETPEVTDDGMAKLQGQGTPGSKVAIWAGGKRLGEATVGDDGTWAYTAELEPGDHEITVQNTDNPDLVSEAVAITVPEKEEAPATPSEAEEEVVCGVGEAPKGVDQGDTYIVARCEYMALIAQRTRVKLADLIAANPQVTNPDLIYPGQVLNLPPRD